MMALRISSMPSVFGMKPDAPKPMQRRITAGSSLADTTTTGTLGILRAQIHQPGEAAHARHGQVEQDQIDVAALVEQLRHFVERAGLGDLGAVEQAGDRFAQRAAEQRMIVRDDQSIERFGQDDLVVQARSKLSVSLRPIP